MRQRFHAPHSRNRKTTAVLTALLLSAMPCLAFADTAFTAPAEFSGRFRSTASAAGKPIFAGSSVEINGSGLTPGQTVVLQRGTTVLTEAPLIADDKGAVSATLALPADAALGVHPVVALLENPSAAAIIEMKVSQDLPLSGAEHYTLAQVQPAPGLYQSAYSARSEALFVTSASYRPVSSALIKLDPTTLAEIARITPAADAQKPLKEGEAAAPIAVLGVAVDDLKGTVWVTNTFDNTVAVYAQDDLALIKQFPADQVYHSRDVRVDAARGRAYVSSAVTDTVHVFDTESLEPLAPIRIKSAKRGADFSLLGLGIDPKGQWLFALSRESNELALIDLDTGAVERVLDLPGAKNASGVDYDPESGKLFIASQDSDNLLIIDAATGTVEQNVALGAGPLSVSFEPLSKLIYVANRGAGTLSAVTLAGEVQANLDGGSYANHVSHDGKGTVFAINKSLGEDDASGDKVTRVAPVK